MIELVGEAMTPLRVEHTPEVVLGKCDHRPEAELVSDFDRARQRRFGTIRQPELEPMLAEIDPLDARLSTLSRKLVLLRGELAFAHTRLELVVERSARGARGMKAGGEQR